MTKKEKPILEPLAREFFADALSYSHYGRDVLSGGASTHIFVKQKGIGYLLTTYPELHDIEPKSQGETLRSTIELVIADYLQFKLKKFLKTFVSCAFKTKERKEVWDNDQRVLVSALRAYEKEIQEYNPTFVAPPEEEGYTFHYSFSTRYVRGTRYEKYKDQENKPFFWDGWEFQEITLYTLYQWRKRHIISFLSDDEIYRLLFDYALKEDEERDKKEILPLSKTQQKDFSEIVAILRNGVSFVENKQEQEEIQEEKQFSFCINFTGCQAEECTHSIEVDIKESELLSWLKQNIPFAEEKLWSWIVYEKYEATFDDHSHEIEMSYEDEDEYKQMVVFCENYK